MRASLVPSFCPADASGLAQQIRACALRLPQKPRLCSGTGVGGLAVPFAQGRFGEPVRGPRGPERSRRAGNLPELNARPVWIAGTTMALRGRIDRLDLRADHSAVRVTDYKSASVPARPDKLVIAGGRELQRALYALTCQQADPDPLSEGPVPAVLPRWGGRDCDLRKIPMSHKTDCRFRRYRGHPVAAWQHGSRSRDLRALDPDAAPASRVPRS